MSERDPKQSPPPNPSALHVRAGVAGGHDGLDGAGGVTNGNGGARRRLLSAAEYVDGVLSGDRVLLARAITLIESNAAAHQDLAQEVLTALLPQRGRSVRVGITGVPGAGKSTFIEAAGHDPDRPGPQGGRHGGRSLEQRDRRQHPRRQDPHGEAGRRSRRLHPAVAHGRHPRRRGPQDPRNDRALRGGRLRRDPGRDRRRGAERDPGPFDGGLLPAGPAGRRRRRAAGHQEGCGGDRRRHR